MKKMKCSYCGIEMEARRATPAHPYRYKLSGLKDLMLTGIDVLTCPKCQHESAIIPRVAELHTVIAAGLIHQPRPLRGDEIRFLRKHVGFPAKKFASLIGVSPEHLSRIENGHTKNLGKPTDRLVRTLAITAKEGRDARTTLLSIADDLAKKRKHVKRVRREPAPYELDANRWRQSA
jgi:transcriptional regulator with XRE-family HTH domain